MYVAHKLHQSYSKTAAPDKHNQKLLWIIEQSISRTCQHPPPASACRSLWSWRCHQWKRLVPVPCSLRICCLRSKWFWNEVTTPQYIKRVWSYPASQVNIIHQDKVIHSKMQGQYTNWLYGYICQLAADCVKCVLNKAGRVWHNHDASSFWGHFVVYAMFWLLSPRKKQMVAPVKFTEHLVSFFF